jgi:hypothetical protein
MDPLLWEAFIAGTLDKGSLDVTTKVTQEGSLDWADGKATTPETVTAELPDSPSKGVKMDCYFCGNQHARSEGDVATKAEICPLVRFLKVTWGDMFQFIRGGWHKTHGRRILFYGQKDKKPHPEVLIFPRELPVQAWLRFELEMLKQKYSNVHNQNHRLLCCNLHRIGDGSYSQEWMADILGSAKSVYSEVIGYSDEHLLENAYSLAMRGYRVWHPLPHLRVPGQTHNISVQTASQVGPASKMKPKHYHKTLMNVSASKSRFKTVM